MTTKLTKQGVRDLGGNRKLPPPACSHPSVTKTTKNTTGWSTLYGEYETRIEVEVCNKCGEEIS